MIHVTATALADVKIVSPARHVDRRGWFAEAWSEAAFAAAGLVSPFVQDNLSFSAEKGVVRGLHYQREPHAQTKLVRVLTGAVLDVAVDLRPASATFGRHVAVELTAESGDMLWIPQGFAHGFCTLTAGVHLLYKVSAPYAPAHDRTLCWHDPQLAIPWPVDVHHAVVSDRDAAAPSFADVMLAG